ncbi:MAG: hypothetical protein WCQ67_08065 [Treponema sp.]
MKKITKILAAVTTALLLSFTGCTTGNPDLEVALTPAYIIGGATAGDSTGTSMWGAMRVPLTFTNGVATYSFTYSDANANAWSDGSGKTSFKLLLDESGATVWGTSTSALAANTDLVLAVGGGNVCLNGLTTDSVYTITITASGATVKASWTQTSAAKLSDANVSALNSTTAVQAGAYVKIESSNCAEASSLYLPFNGSTSVTRYFYISADETLSNWGTTPANTFACWFKFYAGDNSTLNVASAQFKASAATTLGSAATLGTSGDNFICTDMMGGAGTYSITIATTTDGATMTLAKIN